MTAETPWPVLRLGSTGPDVTTLQYLLRCVGYAPIADGVYGTATEGVVGEFQELAGLEVDGIVGELTWAKLTDGIRSKSTVSLGSTGEAVRAAQNELLKHGYFGSGEAVDGIFGNGTAEAVHAFQERVNLPSDSVVGPLTWRELIGRAAD